MYQQRELGLEAAYQLAGQTMACNMMDAAAQEGARAFAENAHRVEALMAMDTGDFLLDDVGQWLGAFASPTVLIELASLLVCVGWPGWWWRGCDVGFTMKGTVPSCLATG